MLGYREVIRDDGRVDKFINGKTNKLRIETTNPKIDKLIHKLSNRDTWKDKEWAIFDKFLGDNDDFVSSLSKLHNPPSGAIIEKDRLEYYTARSIKNHKEWTNDMCQTYAKSMDYEFSLRPPPKPIVTGDVFDEFGNLRRDVFKRAFNTVQPSSSPGYPFVRKYSSNSTVDVELLYYTTNKAIKWFWSTDRNKVDWDDFKAMLDNCLYPSHVFIKKEPTKADKIARLIYGLPLNINIISRILTLDYLNMCKDYCYVASHKVGMDMYTDRGLEQLFAYWNRLGHYGLESVSTDVQGWEYSDKYEMHEQWHKSFCNAVPNISEEYAKAIMNLCDFTALAPICFSDGHLWRLGKFIKKSGLLTTHVGNSDERAALARSVIPSPNTTRNGVRFDVISTNGDDCGEGMPSDMTKEEFISHYAKWGFIITDIVINKPNHFHFCSQIFTKRADRKSVV